MLAQNRIVYKVHTMLYMDIEHVLTL